MRRLAGPATPLERAVTTTPAGGGGGNTLAAQIAYNELGGYCVPTASSSRPSAQRILRGDVWEPQTLALIEQRVRSAGGGDVVHAGTYFGDFLPALSRAVGTDGRVWAYEPNPENHRCAQITTLLNDLANVELHRAGLGARASVGRLLVADGDGVPLGGGSRFVSERGAADTAGATEMQIVTIDGTVPADRSVAVIQLDVEGFEDDALRGARDTLQRCRPLVIVERTPSAATLDELLAPLGYRVTRRVHYNTVLESGAADSEPTATGG
jgi:FkbM family methyltransferase